MFVRHTRTHGHYLIEHIQAVYPWNTDDAHGRFHGFRPDGYQPPPLRCDPLILTSLVNLKGDSVIRMHPGKAFFAGRPFGLDPFGFFAVPWPDFKRGLAALTSLVRLAIRPDATQPAGKLYAFFSAARSSALTISAS